MITLKTTRQESYDITVDADIWESIQTFLLEHYSNRKCILIIDENVKNYHGIQVRKHLNAVFSKVHEYVVPAGETSKNAVEWQNIVDFALRNGAYRNTPLIAVGGGVTGDLAGFAAASVMRGIPLIHVPTTLLAMVDSSIGGKTGINHGTGKNLIGAFYQPDAVWADVKMMKTLPEEEWLCGLGEVIKYGAISNKDIIPKAFERMQDKAFDEVESWIELIRECASIKADIVQKDERESGVRAYLNFGHTFAHAIEAFMNYKGISHGAAVYAGMIAALKTSNMMGADLSYDELLQFKDFYQLDLSKLKNHIDELTQLMYHDKKMKSDLLRVVLLSDWERPYVTEVDNNDVVKEGWAYLFSQI